MKIDYSPCSDIPGSGNSNVCPSMVRGIDYIRDPRLNKVRFAGFVPLFFFSKFSSQSELTDFFRKNYTNFECFLFPFRDFQKVIEVESNRQSDLVTGFYCFFLGDTGFEWVSNRF